MGLKNILAFTALIFALYPASAEKLKPVSVSYQNVVLCFPELESDSISFKVDLNLLKDIVDGQFATSQSRLMQRKVHYLDPDKKAMTLILQTKLEIGKKVQTELILQQVDDKGVVTDLALTANQRLNPKQEVINNFLLGANIKSDEYTYIDTKLNGFVATYSRNFKDVQDYDLSEEGGKRRLLCEKRSDLGIICTCTKK